MLNCPVLNWLVSNCLQGVELYNIEWPGVKLACADLVSNCLIVKYQMLNSPVSNCPVMNCLLPNLCVTI